MTKVTEGQPGIASGKKKETIPSATASLSFPKKGKIQPEGWAGIGIANDVQFTLKGKIVSLSDNSHDDWDSAGKNILIELTGFRLAADREKPMSMDEAMGEEMKTRKRV
jgi:hypothetical protein